MECWLPIPEYEGIYEVSNIGRVRSFYFDPPRIIAVNHDSCGYPIVMLSKGGKRSPKTLHRLVCRAFHGERPLPGLEVAHLNGDRTDAKAENLAWVSKAENHRHRRQHGTILEGERHPRAKLTNEAVIAIRADVSSTARQLASVYGVSLRTIEDVRQNYRWRHLGPKGESAGLKGIAQTPVNGAPQP